MKDVYIARQPIFDKDMAIFGYKLLFAKNTLLFIENEEDDTASASLVDNILLAEYESITEGFRGFVKFTKNLLAKEAPFLFPGKNMVVELPGDIPIDEQTLSICAKLKSEDYIVAIDDFDLDSIEKYQPILEHVDIVKVCFDAYPIERQSNTIHKYKKELIFLAKKVETREDFVNAATTGYKLFQGSFYSQSVSVDSGAIGSFPNNLVMIASELAKKEPDFSEIAAIFERDVELSYKILRMVNSAYYGVKYHTDSIHLALVQLGAAEITRWINVLMMKEIRSPENDELVKASIIRGKTLSQLANATNNKRLESNYFISGLFSSIDVLLNEDMKTIVERLPLGDAVCSTLLGEDTQIRRALDAVLEYERGNWDHVEAYLEEIGLGQEEFTSLYVEAIKWHKTL